MSHITVARIKIQNPDLNLLKQTLSIIAQELKTQLLENAEVRDYYGRAIPCTFVLALNPHCGKAFGIGIKIENGELEIVGDDWAFGYRFGHGFSELAQKITQYYTALAVAQVAQQLGFQIQNIVETQEGAVIIDLAR